MLAEYSDPNATAFRLHQSINQRRTRRRPYEHDSTPVFLYRGMYAELLQGWMEHFELGKNLMVVSYERFSEDHLGVIHQLQRFVGANQTNITEKVLEKDYHGGYTASKLNETTRHYLQDFFRPYNDELVELLGQDWYDEFIGTRWGGEGVVVASQ